MEINYPGEKLLIKLWDTVAVKGIGSLLQPWQMRRVGLASAEIKRLNSLMVAQTKVDTGDIQAGRRVLLQSGEVHALLPQAHQDGSISRLALAVELEEIVSRNVQNEAIRREVSLAKALIYAEDELAQDAEAPNDQTVSDDWLLRWRDNAASISSDELQALWGKVLAGEVKSPGAFSLRTLEFLRNISRDDAALIENLGPYVLNDFVVRPINQMETLGALNFASFLELQDMGILSSVEALGMQTNIKSSIQGSFQTVLSSNGKVLLVKHSDEARTLSLPIFLVTKLGREVLKLGWKKADETYLCSLGKRIKDLNFNVDYGDRIDAGQGQMTLWNLRRI